ncbi:hypothetical protein P2318_19885 [Myxococcaceae bacterium GXIMD 01537]
MGRNATVLVSCLMIVLPVMAVGCGGEAPAEPVVGDEFSTSEAAASGGTTQVTLCNLPRYTRQSTLRLCGFVTSGGGSSPANWAWFSIDGSGELEVTPGNGGFVEASTSLTEGSHLVSLIAPHSVWGLTRDETTVTVDQTPPSLSVVFPTSADKLTSTVVDVTSVVEDVTPVRIETQWVRSSTIETGMGAATHTIDLVNRGYSTLLVRATDAAHNVTEVRVQVYVCFDNDPKCAVPAVAGAD